MSELDKKDKNQQEINEKISLKLIQVQEARKLSSGNRWSPAQDIMQEIVATYTVKSPGNIPSVKKLREELISEIKKKYEDNIEQKQIILDSVPNQSSISKWLKRPDFDEAIWTKIRAAGLFTKERRVEMINALFTRGIQRDTQAAKVWLQLSGDLREEDKSKDKTLDTFREINQILHKKESK